MKKLLSAALVALVALVVCAACLCACGGEQITLNKYSAPVSLHTPDQYSFIESDDISVIDVYVDGKAEKSRPQPVELKWTDSARGSSYTVEISESKNFADCLSYPADGCSVSVYNLKIGVKYYWRVKAKGGAVVSATGEFTTAGDAPRNLYVDGVTNVRDIGGYITSSGKRMMQGLIYRGGRLNKSDVNDDGYATPPQVFVPEITEAGAKTLTDVLKVKTEVDLRLLERNGYPATKPAKSAVTGVEYVRIPMNGNASIDTNADKIKEFMELLTDRSIYPVYFHCNIGTDRTGMFTYLLQGLCGVDETAMLKDYLFSNYGNIGEAKTPQNSKNKFVILLGANGEYAGQTTAARVESYFKSIGVSEATYNAVRDILMGEAA